jgi:sensor histidine kinase YesM
VAYTGIFSVGGGGVQQIQLRTEDRENGDLGAVAPYSGVLEATVIWYKKFHMLLILFIYILIVSMGPFILVSVLVPWVMFVNSYNFCIGFH